MNQQPPARPPVPTGVVPSRLTSDQPTLLQPWTAREEEELQTAQQRLDSLRARRSAATAQAEQKLYSLFGWRDPKEEAVGLVETMIQHAEAVRDILKPFDSGVGAASRGE